MLGGTTASARRLGGTQYHRINQLNEFIHFDLNLIVKEEFWLLNCNIREGLVLFPLSSPQSNCSNRQLRCLYVPGEILDFHSTHWLSQIFSPTFLKYFIFRRVSCRAGSRLTFNWPTQLTYNYEIKSCLLQLQQNRLTKFNSYES